MDILRAACAHLGVDPSSVLSHRMYEDHIALVVDKGIKGCPKYEVDLSELVELAFESGEEDEVDATPAAISLAAERGIDLADVGEGRITVRDVRAYIKEMS